VVLIWIETCTLWDVYSCKLNLYNTMISHTFMYNYIFLQCCKFGWTFIKNYIKVYVQLWTLSLYLYMIYFIYPFRPPTDSSTWRINIIWISLNLLIEGPFLSSLITFTSTVSEDQIIKCKHRQKTARCQVMTKTNMALDHVSFWLNTRQILIRKKKMSILLLHLLCHADNKL
jgi:hypothetical protein